MLHYKKITDKLYQCLADDVPCKQKLSFGLTRFCAWMLRGQEGHTEKNIPCCCKKSTEDHTD